MTSTQELFTDLDKREYIRFASLADAHDKGEQKGKREGIEEGVRTYRRNIVALATVRGLDLSAHSLDRLHACENLEQLARWMLQVATDAGPIVDLDG